MTRVRRLGRATFASLGNPNYRRYFVGQIVSVSGTWMQRLAQAWLVLRLTDGSGVALGIETALQFVPMLLLGAWGGVVADRFDKRRLLIVTQIVPGLLAAGLGLVVWADAATLPVVFAFTLGLGLVNVFDNPARQTFVLEMVGREDLPNAVALNSVVMNTSRVVGPAIGGIVIEVVGLVPCFLLNAASYAAVVVALLAMDVARLRPAPRVPRAKGQTRAGLRYVWSEPRLRTPLLMMAVIGTLGLNAQVVIPLIATGEFGLGAGGFGGLTSALGTGAVVGGLAAASRRGVSYRRLVGLAAAMGGSILLAAIAPTLGTEALALFTVGVCSFAFVATANATLQLTSRPDMRGRVMALYAIAFLGTTPIGAPLVGWICAAFGPRAGFVVGGAGTLLAAAWAGWSLARMGPVTAAEAPTQLAAA
ncbi:MAG: MFS transporter [Actinomycetota bacterium]